MTDFLSQHGAKALKDAASLNTNSNSSNFAKENIWFDWGKKDEHVIRIVGDFKSIRSHWIGESKFGQDVNILNATAFKGDNKIPMNVACGNWDAETESSDPDGDACPICRLGRNADAILKKHGKELDEADKAIFKAIRRKCAPKCQYLFKVIDRENPYVDDEHSKKGYKILKAPEKLFVAIIELSKKMNGVGISSPDKGIDVIIKKTTSETKKTDVSYSVLPVMEGINAKVTPLTEEELQFHDLDLLKFAGKTVDRERFEEELTDENNVRTIYENVDMEVDSNANAEDDGNAPF